MEARPTTKHERECLVEIITPREQIRKFFFEKHFDFLTSVPQQRLQEMILSSCMKGHSGKMSHYGECGPAHRTTYGHFLSKGKWDDKRREPDGITPIWRGRPQKIGSEFDTSKLSDEYSEFGEFTGTFVGITCGDRMMHNHMADFDFFDHQADETRGVE